MQVVVHTGEVPPAYRLARYREVVRALPVPLETGADPTADFLVRMSSETFGEMAVARISSAAPTSYQIKRTRELIRRSDPEAYRLVLTRRGRMSLSHAGRSALLGPRVTSVQHTPDGRPLVHLATAHERGPALSRMRDGVEFPARLGGHRARDLPMGGRRTELRWRKRRWRCAETECPRRTFTEQVPGIPARARLTGRLRHAAEAAFADGGRTVLQAARDHTVSWPIVNAAMLAHAQRVLPEQVPPVAHLGIDETRRGRATWR